MKLARYELNGTVGYGIVDGNTIKTLDACPWTDFNETGESVALEDVKTACPGRTGESVSGRG